MIMDATSMYNFENYNLGPGFVQHTSCQYPRKIWVVPELSLLSQLHICKFVGLFVSLLFNNCDDGFSVAAE